MHTTFRPFIERELNQLDSIALTSHVFCMYAGSMFLTEKLDAALQTSYAFVVIAVSTWCFVFIARYAVREVRGSWVVGAVGDGDQQPCAGRMVRRRFTRNWRTCHSPH